MGSTSVPSGSTLAKQAYHAKLFNRMRQKAFFGSLMGERGDSPIQTVTDLEKEKGDIVNIYHIGEKDEKVFSVEGDNHELMADSLSQYKDQITLKFKALNIKDDGPMTRKRPPYNLDLIHEERLIAAGAQHIDSAIFDAAQGTPITTLYGGSATSTATLTAADYITLDLVSELATRAKGQDPVNDGTPRLEDIRFGSASYAGLLIVSYDVWHDLKVDSASYNKAVIAAQSLRGVNPIFDGGEVMVHDGIIIKPHNKVYSRVDGGAGSNVKYSNCIFMGAGSIGWAWGAKPKMVYKLLNADTEHFWSYQLIYGVKQPSFNSISHGVYHLAVATRGKTGFTATKGIANGSMGN